MSLPIGLLRFTDTSGHKRVAECSDISLIEPHEGTTSKARICMKNGQERYSSEASSTLMDRYDEMVRAHYDRHHTKETTP